MGKVKKSSKSKSKGGSVASKAKGAIGALLGGGGSKGSGGGRRKNRGVAYWANKVMVAKLKKKFYRIQYGGLR